MGVKASERIDGCFARAAENEPIFVLRSTDEISPIVVRLWATIYELKKKALGQWDERAKQKAIEARATADEMEYYRSKVKPNPP